MAKIGTELSDDSMEALAALTPDNVDLTAYFNTPLSAKENQRFQDYIADHAITTGRNLLKDKYDYDVQGEWKASQKAGKESRDDRGHGPDTYKKPNHMTFSDQSQYATTSMPGGQWKEKDGKVTYTPSKTNGLFHANDAFAQYMKQYEPDVEIGEIIEGLSK